MSLVLGGCPDGTEGQLSATEATSSTEGEATSSTDGLSGDPSTSTTTTGDSSSSTGGAGGTTTLATGSSVSTGTSGDGSSSSTSGDEGSSSGTTTGAGECGNKALDEGEECDLGEMNGPGEYGGCNEDCTLQPGCKDGEHQPDFGEECDPTDPGLAEAAVCTDACTWDGVIVFVSSVSYMGDLGGLDGADGHCQELASDAGLIMPEQYRAWLSVGKQTAADRVPLVEDPYYRLDGKKIANNADDLLGGKLLRTINITETKKEEGVLRVWTNTTSAGQTKSEVKDCQSFSSPNKSEQGYYGMTNKTGADWTVSSLPTYCNEESRIYCFSAAF